MSLNSYAKYFALPPAIFENPYIATLLPIAVGSLIGYSARPQQTNETYFRIKKPPFNPPGWLFGPAWTMLYGLMGYASYRAWTVGHKSLIPTTQALSDQGALLYTVQLALNFIWMPLFFGNGLVVAATADILALTGTVCYLTYTWSKIDDVAAYCMLPYIGWLTFASYLSIGIGILNDWKIYDGKKKGL